MKRQKLPNIDSVEGLAKFWDTHDLTDFEEDLEEAGDPVFCMCNAHIVEHRPETF
jgi:hypothetical protein